MRGRTAKPGARAGRRRGPGAARWSAAAALCAACGGSQQTFAEPEFTPLTGTFDLVSLDGRPPGDVMLGRDTTAGSATTGRDVVVGRAFLTLYVANGSPVYRAETCTAWLDTSGPSPLALTYTDGNSVRMTSVRDFVVEGRGTLLYGTGKGFRQWIQAAVDSVTVTSTTQARFGRHVWRFTRSDPSTFSCAWHAAATAARGHAGP
jgi:hypothetical protein